MIKRFCDGCGTELFSSAYTLKIETPDDNKIKEVYRGDLCWGCKNEVEMFISEQCKHHLLTRTDNALGDLEV
jgi:hypothetical protein